MRIPLDYYRILGLPIQASADQLQQAYRDRSLQLPRRGFSDAAIAARKQLLDEAYAVLADPARRQAYNASFLNRSRKLSEDASDENNGNAQLGKHPELPFRHLSQSESSLQVVSEEGTPDPYTPSIEVQDGQLVGALLILLELGEYELVLRLGQTQLQGGSPKTINPGGSILVPSDIVLALSLGCLELGREQWQQGQYENAATSLEIGQDLLLREGSFAGVRGEIQSDLFKLRPYRILELLSLSEENAVERRRGLQLLRDMLQERRGIDGTGNDQSGLNVEDFLRFIQQLRSYLTAAEQQVLFEEEARRPSAVATYLAVYTLLSRGFVQRQPALIRRAKAMLTRLGSRQDVHLEQAVCALLLGQTDEASRSLELSSEQESIAFIRQHSQDAPDLLPGLCLYSERWLQEEVCPHFRDLQNQRISLKEYFADDQVQSYLEELPLEGSVNDWMMMPPPDFSSAASSQSLRNQTTANPLVAKRGYSSPESIELAPAVLSPEVAELGDSNNVPAAIRADQESKGNPAFNGAERRSRSKNPPDADSDRNSRRSREPDQNWIRSSNESSSAPRPSKQFRIIALGILAVLGFGLLGFLTTRTYAWLARSWQLASNPALKALQGEQPMLTLDRPPLAIPSPPTPAPPKDGSLTKEQAQQAIQSWLAAKAKALGPEYGVEQLNQILVDPILSQWLKRAASAKREGWYWQYKHQSTVKTLELSNTDPNQAKVEAEVGETAELFEGGQLNQSASYDRELRVLYSMIRQDGQWRIRDIVVLR